MTAQTPSLFSKCIAPVEKIIDVFEDAFADVFDQDIRILKPILNYAGNTEGKRLRPILFFLTQGLVGAAELAHVTVAVMLEMLHTVSLIHDDVVDESDQRRGMDTMNARWGNKLAVLTGDYLLAKMLSMGIENGYGAILKRISDVAVEMGRGELMQGFMASQPDISLDYYYAIIEKKTAMLFGVASELAGVVTGQSTAVSDHLYQLGLYFGMSFQIKDDILDLTGNDDVMGKPSGQDLFNGKVNIPLVFAMNTVEEKNKTQLEALLDTQASVQLEDIRQLLDVDKGIELAQQAAREYSDKTRDLLKQFDNSEYRVSIDALLEFNLDRMK